MLALHAARGTWQNQVSAYIALTHFQKQKLIQGGLPAHKIHVKPNFADVPAQSVMPPREKFVLFVGRLAEEKGVGLLINAYLQDPHLPPLKLVGDGPLKDSLVQQVAVAGMNDRIHFLGRQEKPQVLSLMQRAQVLVFPSIWYEGFPLTLAEAFACGLPAIVPNLGSMAEIVIPGVTGFHFIPQSSSDLLKILRSALSSDLNLLSHQASQTYQRDYTGSINYDRLISIYQTLL